MEAARTDLRGVIHWEALSRIRPRRSYEATHTRPGDEMMKIEATSQRSEPRAHTPGGARKRIATMDLMEGAREVILLHEGEEYVLRITKAGKLILTK